MKIHDYIVVGSGASGSMSAQTLVEAGKEVLMVDFGAVNEDYNKIIPDKDYLSIRKSEDDQYKYFIGENAEGLVWGDLGKGAQLTPPRNHLSAQTDKYLHINSTTFNPVESLGYGGLGIGWGLQCWQYSEADLKDAGLDSKRMIDAYETVSARIGISATKDEFSSYTMGKLKTFQKSADFDRNHKKIYQKYVAKKQSFVKNGIYVSRTPLALITKSIGKRKAYAYRDMDYYSDKDQSAWRPWITVNALREKENFTYTAGYLAVSYEEKKDYTVLHCINAQDNSKTTFECRKLILAANPISSARIVMRSTNTKTKKRVPILCNPYTYIPSLQPSMVGKAAEKRKLGFAQLTVFFDKKGTDSGISVASLYSYQSLMLFRVIRQIPFDFFHARIIMRYLMSGLVIMGVHHPDSISKTKYLELVQDENSPTGDSLNAQYVLSEAEQSLIKEREKVFAKTARKLGIFPLAKINPGYGSSIHYAGTLPFSDISKDFSLSKHGKLHKTKSVYVADSSGFKYLPAKGLTFTLLANAHLTALNAINDET